MDEKDAIELLNKLEKWMTATNDAIKNLNIKVHNLEIDVEHFKKNQEKARIILRN